MSLSLFARKIVAIGALASALPSLVFGQANFSPLDSEFSTLSLPHDQMAPRASINTGGGYLVWQDVFTDKDGLGISGLPLNSDLAGVLTPFRINQIGAGDQEKPQVALLHNGGAVFAWQGGKQGFQQVYIRFLSASNTWLTSDMLVSSVTHGRQNNVALAVLNDGNVIAVWASHDQRSSGSMQDVYGQLFSPNGQKIGNELPINEVSVFNQRTPALTALNTGGFAVAWISEQQRPAPAFATNGTYTAANIPTPSVDVYARLFDANGTAVSPEFQVNGTNRNVCANPAVAAAADGSIIVAWSRKDTQVRNNSWDVFATRVVPGAVVSVGAPIPVNTQLYGDQVGPQVSAVGNDILVTWTSLAQDGSFEGVYGQYLTSACAPVGGEFRVNTVTASRQIQPALASDGAGRFLALWSTYVGGGAAFDVHGQVYASENYVAAETSTNYLSPTFVRDVISDPTPIPKLVVPVPPPAGGAVSNAFAMSEGNYSGLFYDETDVNAASAGYFTASTTASRGFSAKLRIGNKNHSLSGNFNGQGTATRTISRAGLPALTVTLQLDMSGAGQIHGQITDGSWTATLLADRQVFSKANPAPQAGKYTLVVPKAEAIGGPVGSSFGQVTIDAAGKIKFAGTMADGTKVTQSAAVSQNGLWPLFISPYGGKGLVISWQQFADEEATDISGRAVWIRPPGGKGFYSGGFTNEATATGSKLSVGAAAQQRNPGESDVAFSGGGVGTFTNVVTWNDGRAAVVEGGKMTLTIASASGLFKGTAADPDSGRTLKFQGAVLKKGNVGAGFFLNNTESGEVHLNPLP